MKVVKRDPDKGYLANWLWVPKKWTNVNALMSSLSMVFTDGYTGDQKILYLWKDAPHHVLVPRMLWPVGSLHYEVIDCRPQSFQHVAFKSRIKLDYRPVETSNGRLQLTPTGDTVQQLSIDAMQRAMGGVLQLACGKGKTVIALEHIARNQVPALIVVDNSNLLYQWEQEINRLLEVPGGVGHLMSGKATWEGRGIVLATYQTLGARADDLSEEFRRYFGAAYYDEGHHASAPVFSRGVSIIYGRRYSLTATPERDDGQHIIADFHIGPVLHKDLRPTMKPHIYFYWTGMELDLTNPEVTRACFDVNGELHLSRIKNYFGRWRDRMWLLLNQAVEAVNAGRKTLLLSDSVDEVVNLMTMWTRGPHAPLYTDLPVPTVADVGEQLLPYPMSQEEANKAQRRLEKTWERVAAGGRITDKVNEELLQWQQYLVYKKIMTEYRKRQKQFVKELIDEPSGAGFMTYGVPPKIRRKFLDERQIIFGIMKYGKEGLDCPDLDTVLVSHLFSSKNVLQQLKGRPTRHKVGKKPPVIVFFVDSIGQMRGMEQKLMKHLRQWPHEEGGPYDFNLINYPKVTACKVSTLTEAFGRSSTLQM